MQQLYSDIRTESIRKKSKIGGVPAFFSTLQAILGIITLAALICRSAENIAAKWSPTVTARECFPFHDGGQSFERDTAAQMLLSAAFFGSDALYFDGGEENTGMTEPHTVNPSDISGEDSPQTPIGEPTVPLPGTRDIYSYDRSKLPEGELALLPYDLTNGADGTEILISNATSLEVDIEGALNAEYPITTPLDEYSADEPLILIIHTHGTESYSPSGALSVSPNFLHRSSDTNENVVSVGKVMADMLNSAGIPTVHCEVMHDLESYTHSYNLAADTIQKYLTKYPSIRYVFDVHRDAIVRTNGDLIRPITMINGELTAQIMLLVGTNEKGADHPDWDKNFAVAVDLQNRLYGSYPRFARPINIRGASFNEQFTPGSLLIEIGSAANSLDEAKAAAKYLTYSIIDMIKEHQG